jgi:RHH-type proline utilization regulon transcriptional repressor/proline dehydrogenase/delta 1-pyrroline-5-carboxylate dehydrogenase
MRRSSARRSMGWQTFPVYTRKVHTDVAYIACARKLLAARDVVFPQFATHNAQTLARSIIWPGRTLRREIMSSSACTAWASRCMTRSSAGLALTVPAASMRRWGRTRRCSPISCGGCWRTAPILLRQPHRRSCRPIEELIADPVEQVRAMARPGKPHDLIALPARFSPTRRNSAGIDLSNEAALTGLGEACSKAPRSSGQPAMRASPAREIVPNPATIGDVVGMVREVSPSRRARL